MLWRHLFEEFVDSEEFVIKQLEFQRGVYQKVQECYQNQGIAINRREECGKKMEVKLEQYAIGVQLLITQREKQLQNELRQCKGKDILNCINLKTQTFIKKHLNSDKHFLTLFRQQAALHLNT